ncbi:MAG: hypothetical protein AAGI37_14155 [Planctomycetota bacterium]
MSDIVTDILTAYLSGKPLEKNPDWDMEVGSVSETGQVMANSLGLSEINIDTICQSAKIALDHRRNLPANEVAELFSFYREHYETERHLSYVVQIRDLINDFAPDSTLTSILPLWIKQLNQNRVYTLSETLPGLEAAQLDSSYIEPTFEEYTGDKRVGFGLAASLRNRTNPTKIAGIPAIVRRFRGLSMVFADPGSGKTTFSHRLCRHVVSSEVTGRTLFPVLIRLRDISGDPEESVLSSFFMRCLGSAYKDSDSESLSLKIIDFFQRCSEHNGPLPLFVLDGLDEYRGPDSWLVDEVGVLSALLGPVVVTSRLGVESDLIHLADARYRIQPLELDEMSRLVRSLIPHELEHQQVFDHLDRYPDLRRLAANPFILSAFCGLHLMPSTSPDSLPRNRTELMSALVEAGFARHRQLNTDKNKVTPGLRRSIHRLAAWMQFDTPAAPQYQFRTEHDPEGYQPDKETVRTLAGARLTQRTWLHGCEEFVHPLVQEFLAGSRIVELLADSDSDQSVMKELVRQADSPRFQGPLQFAVGLTRLQNTSGLPGYLHSLATRMLKTSDPFGVRAFHLARFMAEAGTDRFSREDIDRVLDLLWETVTQGLFDQDLIEAMVSLDPAHIRRWVDDTRHTGDPFEITALPAIENALQLHEDALISLGESRTRAVLAASEARCFRDLSEPLTLETCRKVLQEAQTDEQWSDASKLIARLGGSEAAALVLETTRRGLPPAADESLANALGWVSHPAATDALMAMLARDLQDHDVVDACLFALCNHVFNYGEKILGTIASDPDAPSYRRQAAIQCLGNCYAEDSLATLLKLSNTEQDPELKLVLLKSIAKQDPLSAVHAVQMEVGLDNQQPSRTELLKIISKILRNAKDNYTLVKTATTTARWFLSQTEWEDEPDFAKIALQIIQVDEDWWLDHALQTLQSDDWPHVACAAIGLAQCKSKRVNDELLARLQSIQEAAKTDNRTDLPMQTAAAEAIAQALLQNSTTSLEDLLEYPILKRAVGKQAIERRLILQPKDNPIWTGRNYWFSDPVESDGLSTHKDGATDTSQRPEIDIEGLVDLLANRVKQATQKKGVPRTLAICHWANKHYKGKKPFEQVYERVVNGDMDDPAAASVRAGLDKHLKKCGVVRSGLPKWDSLVTNMKRMKKERYISTILDKQGVRASDNLYQFLIDWDLL